MAATAPKYEGYSEQQEEQTQALQVLLSKNLLKTYYHQRAKIIF